MSAPVALIDANVLYDAVLRDLLMQLALSGFFRPRWSRQINDEWTRSLLANRPDITPAQLDVTKTMMARAVPDGLVADFEGLIAALCLPDPDDRHVLAAAIRAEADVIVTFNLKDFPPSVLQAHGIEARTPDEFLGDLASEDLIAAARECRARLVNPALSAERYVSVLARHGLPRTTVFLRRHLEQL